MPGIHQCLMNNLQVQSQEQFAISIPAPLKDLKPSGKSELIKGGSERALAAAERSVN